MIQLVLLSSWVFCVHALSTCTSQIYMNGAAYTFHVEDAKDVKYEALKFCNKYHIASEECERIVSHHSQKCFPKESMYASEQSAEVSSCDPSTDSCPIDSKASKSSVDPLQVDYSTKVGPVLAVTLGSDTKTLQAYAGELPGQAVHRFCRMQKFDDDQCEQVRKKYFELCAIEVDEPQHEKKIEPTEPEWMSRSMESFFQVAHDAKAYTELYWQWIALVIILAYIIIEHHQ